MKPSETDELERVTFDLVATTVHAKIPRTPLQLSRILTLLREAVREQPDTVHELLDELFNLSTDDKASLKTLLDRTSLASVIKASTSGDPGPLPDWLDELEASRLPGLPSLAKVIREDLPAVVQAITSPYISGVNEGRITDVKLQKRLMAGRAKVPLLHHRVVLIARLRRGTAAAR